MNRRNSLVALFLSSCLVRPSFARAEDGIRRFEDGLPARAVERLHARVDARMRWNYDLMQQLHLGYVLPDHRPEMFLVTREYIVKHEREICFDSKTDEERRGCSTHIYGWTDDDRKVYVLRGEDVTSTDGFPGMRDFPADLWVEMTWTHELVHFIQLEGSTYKPTTLPCEMVGKWEDEAFLIAAQWLHSLQDVDAERINAVFRGEMPNINCAPVSKEMPAAALETLATPATQNKCFGKLSPDSPPVCLPFPGR